MAYELEMENGVVKIKGTSERMILLPANVINKMSEEFYNIVGPASKVMMREIGKCIGECVTEVVEKELEGKVHEASDEQLLQAIANYLSKSGMGKISVERAGDEIVIKMELAPSMKSKNACYLEQGIIMGVLKKLTGKNWKVEVEKQGETCLFKVRSA